MGFSWNEVKFLFTNDAACCKEHKCITPRPSESPSELPSIIHPSCPPLSNRQSTPVTGIQTCGLGTVCLDQGRSGCVEHECDIESPSVAPPVAPTKALFWYPDIHTEARCILGSDYEDWMTPTLERCHLFVSFRRSVL